MATYEFRQVSCDMPQVAELCNVLEADGWYPVQIFDHVGSGVPVNPAEPDGEVNEFPLRPYAVLFRRETTQTP